MLLSSFETSQPDALSQVSGEMGWILPVERGNGQADVRRQKPARGPPPDRRRLASRKPLAAKRIVGYIFID
jgi:hypothetical protein